MVLQMIKRNRYKEILQTVTLLSTRVLTIITHTHTHTHTQELEGRRMTVSKLGMLYHIHDIIGADLVERYIPLSLGDVINYLTSTESQLPQAHSSE